MSKGDHIFVNRGAYTHHGIDVGDEQVIHYTGEPGSKSNASIVKTTLAEFSQGEEVQTVEYGKCLPVSRTVELAYSRLGEMKYHLVFNNCEHFARFCKTGDHESEQVRNVAGGTGASIGSGVTTAGSITAVSAAGSAAGLSGAGVMSGLAAIGPAGAIGGLASLAAIPAVVTNVAVSKTLKDDESLPSDERNLRSAGRMAAKVGTAAGAVGTVGTISAAGTTVGLSATGITSGLAAVGGTVGGGMVAGVAISVAAPAVAAAAAGWGLYKIGKWLKK
jgi:hypothetical protein